MYTFLCECKPRSVQARKTSIFKDTIRDAFEHYNPEYMIQDDFLYGIAYYFHKKPIQIDADNISKPIWDALESCLYDDDKLIKLRHAGVFDLNQSGAITSLDLSKMPTHIYNDFIDKINTTDHLLYIEIGKLNHSLYNFGVE